MSLWETSGRCRADASTVEGFQDQVFSQISGALWVVPEYVGAWAWFMQYSSIRMQRFTHTLCCVMLFMSMSITTSG